MEPTYDVEALVRQHVPWEQLPQAVRDSFKNSRQLWEHEVCVISIRNQLRWRTGLVRKFYLDERKYYEELIQASKENLMLFPYHLSDVIIRRLHVTPFQYYIDIMADLMTKERSYDSLPNFTAKDCLRLLGIGRNEYIDRMNQSKAAKSSGLWGLVIRRKIASALDFLPAQPVDFNMEPWWVVHPVNTSEEALKACDADELPVMDVLAKRKHAIAGEFVHNIVRSLYRKALIYLEVPIYDEDYVAVPPLEGFVMNRVQGDYFETLLYKIFVTIDESTNISELSSVLQIDVQMVKDAVSMYCLLGFAVKKNIELFDYNGCKISPHPSWIEAQRKRPIRNMAVEYEILDLPTGQVAPAADETASLGESEGERDDDAYPDAVGSAGVQSLPDTSFVSSKSPFRRIPPQLSAIASRSNFISRSSGGDDIDSFSGPLSLASELAEGENTTRKGSGGIPNSLPSSLSALAFNRRVGFMFDSSLTAFLMMGNLSLGLKSHAVTMFEVGKLSNESLDAFMDELAKVKSAPISEGDAQRYFDHAVTLYQTLRFLRGESDFEDESTPSKRERSRGTRSALGAGVDLIRYESLSSLDVGTRQRVLSKNYDVLFSMTPVAADCQTLRTAVPPHLGPPIPEVNSFWFKLFVYTVAQSGPPTLVLCTGTRLRHLPELFQSYDELLITVIGRETQVLPSWSSLVTINDLLCSGPLMIQGYRSCEHTNDTTEITRDIPFPFLPDETFPDGTDTLLRLLDSQLALHSNCGYVRLLRVSGPSTPATWVPLEVQFGLPLFDAVLNAQVCRRITTMGLLQRFELRGRHSRHMRALSLRLLTFIATFLGPGGVYGGGASPIFAPPTAAPNITWPPTAPGRIHSEESTADLPTVDLVFSVSCGIGVASLM